MQAQLLEIKELLSVWYLVVLENKIFVTALVVAVWICFSILYAIRAYFLKKQIKITERKSNELQEQLNSSEQTIKANAVTLATAEQQMEEEQQATVEFNKKVSERHQSVVEKIREVARNFDLSEQLVGSSDSISNEVIWQQQDNMIAQLTEKLTAEQNVTSALQAAHKEEVNRMAAADSSAEVVKEGLNVLTKKLELSALKQNKQQELLKNELQGQIIDSLAKNQIEIIKLISKLTAQDNTVNAAEEVQVAPKIVEAEVVERIEPEIPEVIQEKIIEPKPVAIPTPPPAAIPAVVVEPEIVKIDIPTMPLVVEKIPEVESTSTPIAPAPAAEVLDDVQVVPTQKQEKPKVVKKKAEKNKTKKILGFTRSLFSTKGLKKMPKQIVPEVEEVKQDEEVTATIESTADTSEKTRKREEPTQLKKSDYTGGKSINLKGKLKGLLGKKK
jgi:hypothetical protein